MLRPLSLLVMALLAAFLLRMAARLLKSRALSRVALLGQVVLDSPLGSMPLLQELLAEALDSFDCSPSGRQERQVSDTLPTQPWERTADITM